MQMSLGAMEGEILQSFLPILVWIIARLIEMTNGRSYENRERLFFILYSQSRTQSYLCIIVIIIHILSWNRVLLFLQKLYLLE